MSNFKGTKWPWTYSTQVGSPRHCHVAQVWGADGFILADLEATKDETEASANALLISKAPEMLEMLETIEYKLRNGYELQSSDHSKLQQLIKKATEI